MRIYRDAGGANAVLANVAVDFANRPESAGLAEATNVALVCPSDEARRRIKLGPPFSRRAMKATAPRLPG